MSAELNALTGLVTAHRWSGDDDCKCACGDDVGNDHSWSLHLLASVINAGFAIQHRWNCGVTNNYPHGAWLDQLEEL